MFPPISVQSLFSSSMSMAQVHEQSQPVPSLMVPYREVTELVRAGGDLLNLPSRAICTALVFCHRFASASPDLQGLDTLRLATTCLFLASKVEEASLRTNDLVNAVGYLNSQPANIWGQGSTAAQCKPDGTGQSEDGQVTEASPGQFEMLVGEAYYTAKAQLITDEQVLLRVMRFDIGVEQPHKYLLCFAKTLRAPQEVVRLATCALNDSLVYSDACLKRTPDTVAAAALHVAAQLAQHPLPQLGQSGCWGALGLDEQAIASACADLDAMLALASR